MTATALRPEADRVDRRPPPPADVHFTGRPRRKVSLIALGVIVVLGSALGFGTWATSMGDRVGVLAASHSVDAGQVLTDSDLKVVRIGADPGVRMLPANAVSTVVGRVAATSIEAGGLLRPSDLSPRSLIGEDRAVVGVGLKGGAAPVQTLQVGDTVEVVAVAPAANGQAEPGRGEVLATATVFEVRAGDAESGGLVVSLLVPRSRAVAVADAAGADRVRLVLVDQAVGAGR